MGDSFVQTMLGFTDALGHLGVFLLMAVESSFIPFPSEIVVPPAAFLAAQGKMSIYLVVLAGIGGSLVGAVINYYLAMWLGRPLVYALVEKKWARWFLLSPAKVEKAEKHFLEYGALSTFLGRLLPAIRQLISLPAGFTRMPLGKFLFYTGLGSGFWVIILAVLGYFFGANEEVLKQYYGEIAFGFIVVVGVIVALLWLQRRGR